MSDWIKENKFAAAMLAVALVAIVGTYLFSGSKSEAYEEALGAYQSSSGDYSNLVRTEPYPDPAGLESYRKDIVAYRGQVEGLQKALLAFRPEKFEKVRPAEFTTRINEVGDALKKTYDGNGIKYPEKWQLGFESYTSSPPKDNATDFLNYQLDGLDWLYKTLAKSRPSELLNVHRSRLPIEDGQPMGGAAPQGGNQGGRGKQQAGPTAPYFTLPVELTFRGPESSLRRFLTELSNSKEYFYVVRAMRVENTKGEIPPKKSDANFKAEEAPKVKDPFTDGFDFVIPGEDAVPDAPAEDGEAPAPEEDGPADVVVPEVDAPASGDQILGRVLGGEEIFVFLELELILFQDNVALPEVK